MIISGKEGNIYTQGSSDKPIDWLYLEWYEANKRILHKRTAAGREIIFRFLGKPQELTEGDILSEDDETIIAVNIIPCNAIVIYPASMFQMAAVCYEIGNKHLPLFFENDTVMVPFDKPLYNLLSAQCFRVDLEERKLMHPIKTTVAPHGVQLGGELIFNALYKQPV